MARARAKPVIAPSRAAEIEQFNEANSARLGLICVQERIPDDYIRWDVAVNVNGREAKLTCISPSEYGGVPYGLDGDFASVLNVLYMEQGSP